MPTQAPEWWPQLTSATVTIFTNPARHPGAGGDIVLSVTESDGPTTRLVWTKGTESWVMNAYLGETVRQASTPNRAKLVRLWAEVLKLDVDEVERRRTAMQQRILDAWRTAVLRSADGGPDRPSWQTHTIVRRSFEPRPVEPEPAPEPKPVRKHVESRPPKLVITFLGRASVATETYLNLVFRVEGRGSAWDASIRYNWDGTIERISQPVRMPPSVVAEWTRQAAAINPADHLGMPVAEVFKRYQKRRDADRAEWVVERKANAKAAATPDIYARTSFGGWYPPTIRLDSLK